MRRLSALTLAIGMISCLAPAPSAAGADDPPSTFNPKRHLRVSEVEQGMQGYGLSVYSGIEPEPFPVVVVSVERGFQPDKAVVWIRCTDERMQLTGPVQGMSGSPIFLWPKNASGTRIGEGGRMIGAFAFGFRFGKDCYIGVQPIEQMLAAGARAKAPIPGKARASSGRAAREEVFAASYELARRAGMTGDDLSRLNALSKVVGFDPATRYRGTPGIPAAQATAYGVRSPMALPVGVQSPELAAMLDPFFAPLGLAVQPMAAGSGPHPPKWIDPDDAKIKPGSVFTIPLVTGQVDMTALGTCTEVLPDGTALAFGHQFLAEGDLSAPMATGFIHFVQPNQSASFKVGGSLRIKGSVVRDEATAIVGLPKVESQTVPARIQTQWPAASLNQNHHYQIINHDRLLPSMLGSVLAASLSTDAQLARDNTVTIDSTIHFQNGKKLKIIRTLPSATANQLMVTMIPAVSAVMETEFGSVEVKDIQAKVKVEDQVRVAMIVSATLEQPSAKAGDTVGVLVRLKPYRKPETLERLSFKLPKPLPDGVYNIAIGGAPMILQQRLGIRPHLLRADNIDELFDAVQAQLDVKDESLYGVLQLHEGNNLAIGRSELPNLPSSRVALLAVETSTRASPFLQSIESIKQLPYVISGQMNLPLLVRPETEPAP